MVTEIQGEHEPEWPAMGYLERLVETGLNVSFARKCVGAVVAITVAAAVSVTAFVAQGSGSYGRLSWAGSSTSQSMNSAHAGPAGTTWVFGSYNPCVTANPVTVTGIKFTEASGLAMTGWGHKVNRGRGIGSARGTVTEIGFQTGAAQVTLPCSSVQDPNPTNLGVLFIVEFHRTTVATGWADGLSVTYQSNGSTHTSRWPVGIAMCGSTPLPARELLADLCAS